MRAWSCVIAAVALAACGPSSLPSDDDQMGDHDGGSKPNNGDRPDARMTGPGIEVKGVVWAPGNAKGMVPNGEEIPVAGAVVYVSDGDPPDIKEGAYCDPCQAAPGQSVVADAKGNFTLTNLGAGPATLVIQKAQFRLVKKIDIPNEPTVILPATDTTLPSKHDPAHGQWLPRIALVITNSDRIEDIFAKMQMLKADSKGKTLESSFDASSRIDLYTSYPENPDPTNPELGQVPYKNKHKGTIDQLFGSLAKMKQYHLIMVPCAYNNTVGGIGTASVRKNIEDYIAEGGRLYVTDWSAEWADAVFPDFIQFTDDVDNTPATVSSGLINPVEGDAGHFAYHAKAEDPQLRAWLDGQKGVVVDPTNGGPDNDYRGEYVPGVIDGADFVIEGIWTLIKALPTVHLGTDPMGKPIDVTAKTWVSGDMGAERSPHTVTFEPSCGRVMYSTYHTADAVHVGLVPQERVLLYLLMEIGVCFEVPDVD